MNCVRSICIVFISVPVGVGCAPQPVRLLDYRCGEETLIIPAPCSKTYTLHATRNGERVESTTVEAGEPIGFVRKAGSLQAVDGDETIALAEGNYSWFVEPQPPSPPGLSAPYHPPKLDRQVRGGDAYLQAANAVIGWLAAGAPTRDR